MCFTSAVPMVLSSPLILAPYIFIVVTACTFQFVGPVSLLFSKEVTTNTPVLKQFK